MVVWWQMETTIEKKRKEKMTKAGKRSEVDGGSGWKRGGGGEQEGGEGEGDPRFYLSRDKSLATRPPSSKLDRNSVKN